MVNIQILSGDFNIFFKGIQRKFGNYVVVCRNLNIHCIKIQRIR